MTHTTPSVHACILAFNRKLTPDERLAVAQEFYTASFITREYPKEGE